VQCNQLTTLENVTQREAQIAVARKAEIEARASIPNMQVDGYMSRASMNRIQERGGEPLERSEVVRKGKKILGTKKWAGIEVTSPDHESIYYRGKVSQIKWKATGNIAIERVGLYLYLNGEPIHTIVKSVPNVGKYIFTLPEIFQQAEEAYQILVIAEDSKQPDCHGFSGRNVKVEGLEVKIAWVVLVRHLLKSLRLFQPLSR